MIKGIDLFCQLICIGKLFVLQITFSFLVMYVVNNTKLLMREKDVINIPLFESFTRTTCIPICYYFCIELWRVFGPLFICLDVWMLYRTWSRDGVRLGQWGTCLVFINLYQKCFIK